MSRSRLALFFGLAGVVGLYDENIFGSKADLQLHTQIHMREAKPYKCSQCSKAFANSSYLSQHTRIHLGIKPYRCEICQRKFTQLSHLQQHIRTHTGDKPYKCRHPGCNKAFSQLSNLQSHSRCHQTDKPYKCNSCYKCFSDEGSLLEHIPKHKESKHLKTHICQYCGKSYTQETYLAKHMQKHADRMDKRAAHAAAVLAASAPPPPPRGSSGAAANQQPQQQQQQQQPPSHVNSDNRISEGFWSKPPNSSTPDMTDLRIPHLGNHGAHESFLPGGMSDHHSRLQLSRSEMEQHRQSMGNRGDHNEMSHLSPNQVGGYDAPPGMGGSGGGGGGGGGGGNNNVKTSSAFTPIQAAMLPNLPITSSAQLTMPGSSRSYFPYEPISFQKAPGGASEPPKSSHASFPNQLISLHQIKNYASMPSVAGGEHPISHKDKQQQQQQ